jgi:hypothetical protein
MDKIKKCCGGKYRWRLMAEEKPPIGTRFVALFDDGSGASLFECVKDDGFGLHIDDLAVYYDSEALDDYLLWIEVPDDYKFWGLE